MTTHTAHYETDGGTLFIEFDYTAGEPQTWDEPGCPEQIDILAVMAGTIDIYEFCTPEALALFEEKCSEQMVRDRYDAAYDRACDRAEDRAYDMECSA